MFFHITYARYAYNCSMTQFIVAADELPNAQPNPRLELRMEMEMELGLWLWLGGLRLSLLLLLATLGAEEVRAKCDTRKWNGML